MMIDHGTTTDIGRIENDATIIDGMIDMMITDERMILEMIIIGIIVTVIIHQEMIEMTGGHTKVTNIMMIEGGMMIIVDSMMTEGMILYDPKELDNFNIILKVEMMGSHRMLNSHIMTKAMLVDHCQYLTASFVDKMEIMQISVQQKTKGKL